jgi:UDP-N-acetylglucosamine 3-dehydrogenase
MKKLRIGIMSFAHLHAEGYIGNLQHTPGIEYVGMADHDQERGRHYADMFNSPYFESYEALLAEDMDGVIICSENNLHHDLTIMAAESGVHVLCEKPIATNLQDAEAMVAACEAAGVNLMIALPMRFSASASQVKAALERGDIGQLFCANTTNQGENPDYHRQWFSDPELAGGGAVMDHTVHVVDLIRWYTGAEPVEVYAEVDNLFYRDVVNVETAGLLMITFDNGLFISLDTSWSRPTFYPTWGNVKTDLVGAGGVLRTDYFNQKLDVFQGPTTDLAWHFWGSDPNQGMIDEFFASIREKRQPLVTGYDGVQALRVVLSAYESGRTHQVVQL